ncbi:MAG: hypothetical protein AAGA81_16640 [Acidobacteriota bacterium]
MARKKQQLVTMNEENYELGDEDLEMVVGGLSPEASLAQARYLRDAGGDSGGSKPNWLTPTPGLGSS